MVKKMLTLVAALMLTTMVFAQQKTTAEASKVNAKKECCEKKLGEAGKCADAAKMEMKQCGKCTGHAEAQKACDKCKNHGKMALDKSVADKKDLKKTDKKLELKTLDKNASAKQDLKACGKELDKKACCKAKATK